MRRAVWLLLSICLVASSFAKYSPGPGYVGEPALSQMYMTNRAYPMQAGYRVLAQSKPSTLSIPTVIASKPVFRQPTPGDYRPGTLTLRARLCPNGGIPMTQALINEGRSGAFVTKCVTDSKIIRQDRPTFPPRESGWHLYDRFRAPEYITKVYS
ncbi:hypothetical protein HY641_00295 [Candidatus Woesearchaeota archaeon]|nr:hypothetical protein [Candidatus Woesearchaeota archaeon]